MAELLEGIATEVAFDGAGFDQADVNAAARELKAQHIAPAFKREFGGGVGTTEAHRGEAEDGAVVDDAAMSLRAHHRQDAHGEVVPAEQAGIELVGERVAREVFQRGGDGEGAVVKERVKGAAGLFEHPVERHADAVGFGEVKLDGIQPFAFQALHVGGVARAGKDLPAACLQDAGGAKADAAGTAGDEDAFFHDVLEGLLLRGRLYDGFAADSAFSGRAVLNLAGKCYCWLPSSFTYTKAGKVYVTSILSQ